MKNCLLFIKLLLWQNRPARRTAGAEEAQTVEKMRLRNRVVSARMQRMTFQHPFECQISPFKRAIFHNRLLCVLAASGCKTAHPART